VLELLATLSVAIVAVAIGLRVVEGHLDLTTALFVLILAPEAYLPLRQVGSHYHDSADGLAAAENAFALIDAGPAPRADGLVPDLSRSTIELWGVGVRYPGADRDALAPTDLVIGPGELVAVTGPSGGGKSTLVQVLLGFVVPTTGRVSIGGQAGVPQLVDWLGQLAWVPQQPALLAGTIGSNVALGARDAPTARVRAALDRAGGPELDLDQPVAAGSSGLSAGELRRVALARALLRIDCGGGQLLIMDEPTAGLDADTELSAIDGVRGLGVTTLVVSHRPAVLAAADRVVELPAPALVAA
jgi:ABC-type transport system involved in cytochrome bd biosynthesis fused ATPase/permease subunit